MTAPYVNPLLNIYAPVADALDSNRRAELEKLQMAHAAERLGFERERLAQENKLFPLRERTMTLAANRSEFENKAAEEDRPSAIRARDTNVQMQEEALRHGKEIHPWQSKLVEAQVEAAKQKPGFKTEVINGKIIGIMPDGRTQVLHDGGPDFSKLPEFAAKSAAFATRMIDAERNIRDIMAKPNDPKNPEGAKRFDPTSAYTAMQRMAPEGISNFMLRSGEHQQYQQAAEQWIRAFLRKESGAAISPNEFVRDFKVYFPQPGDTKEVMAQKEQARLRAVQGFVGETRDFHKHVDPRGHDTLNEWLNPKVKKPFNARHTPETGGGGATAPPTAAPASRDALLKAADDAFAKWDNSGLSPEEIKQGKAKVLQRLRDQMGTPPAEDIR